MHAGGGAFRSREIYKEASRPAKSEHNHSRLTFFLRLYRKREEFGALCLGYLLEPGVPSTPHLCELSNASLSRFSFFLAHFTSCPPRQDALQFRAQLFHFMGEVEAVFGIWPIPLFLAIIFMKGWPTLVAYITSLSPAEPVFVVVIMAMASSRPVLLFAETLLAKAVAQVRRDGWSR
jgi:hypothetical protein